MALRTAATPHRDGIGQTEGSLDEGNWRQKCLFAGRNAVIKMRSRDLAGYVPRQACCSSAVTVAWVYMCRIDDCIGLP